MAKELPYFKFNASEWISGAITLEDLTTQGAFINICAYYWFKSGQLTLTEIKRRLKLKQATLDYLVNGNHIKVDGDQVQISFLQEQFDERGMISKRNSENGKKGGAPIGNKNAQNRSETQEKTSENNQEQAKTSNIEEEKNKNRIEEEKKREEEKKEENGASKLATIEERKLIFEQKVFSNQPEFEEKMLRQFSDYWTETNEGGKKMRFEKEKVFELKRRIITWRNRQFEFIKQSKQNGKPFETTTGATRPQHFADKVYNTKL